MKNDAYLMINEKKIELTAEQKKQLGIVEEKNCFDRADKYYYIGYEGEEHYAIDTEAGADDLSYAVANYCTDRDLMHQRALHETLSRLLWRYSMTHDGDKIDWGYAVACKYYITFDKHCRIYTTDYNKSWKIEGVVYFNSRIIAENAIEEIVKPFLKEHPDFVW